MMTTDPSETQLKELLNPVDIHPINQEDLRLLIEADPDGLLTHLGIVYVTSSSGSTYQIELLGPTLDKKYYAGTAKVRQASYIRTKANGVQNSTTEYIGLTAGETLRLRFFSNIADESSIADEHSILRTPTSEALDTEIKLVIDWNNQ